MNHPKKILVFCACIQSLIGGLVSAGQPDLSRMNILFICPEDWTTEAIGAYGNDQVITPNLDSFAKESVLFTKAYSQNPVCNPSRSSFNTGLRPATTNVHSNPDKFDESIPGWATTIVESLKEHPIRTFMVGKLFHYNWDAVKQTSAFDGISNNPPKGYQGRVINYKVPEGTPPNPEKDWVHSPDPEWDAKMIEAMAIREKLWATAEKGSEQWVEGRVVFQDLSAEVVGDSGDIEERNPDGKRARVVADLIREHAQSGEQFFITLGTSRPHTPLRAPQKYFDLYDPETLRLTEAKEAFDSNIPPVAKRFGRNWDVFKIRERTEAAERAALHGYYACASFIDDQIGLVLDTLEETGLADNTIVIFTSDHGFHLGEHGMWSKISLFEQSTRVPMIIRVPGVTGGDRTDGIVELVDLYPTLLDILDLEAPHDRFEGVSFLPLIENPDQKWKKAAFSTCKQGWLYGKSVRTATHRYTEWIRSDAIGDVDAPVQFTELYDLEADRWEHRNLAGLETHTEKQDEMAALLHAGWREALPEQLVSNTP